MTRLTGRCTCGEIRYALTAAPLFVHGCHCTCCQRETGSAFVLNALIEASEVELIAGLPETVLTPSASGAGQRIDRCPTCRVAVWSVYSGAGPRFRFVRVGTLDDPGSCPPDVHIYTSTRATWLRLPEDIPQFEAYYDRDQLWPEASRARWRAARA